MERMAKLILCFLLLIAVTQHSVIGWVNNLDGPFDFKCPRHQFLSHIWSIHNNHNEDRVFDLGCRQIPVGPPDDCHETGWANGFDGPLTFQCPNAGVITGIASEHNNYNEDRRFKFQCCQSKAGTCISNCRYTGYVNSYDGEFNYNVKSGYVLRGVNSIHNNHNEDRIFDFEYCELIEC